MIAITEPSATRRRFRFGLRTLLAVVTLAAVGSWGYWIGWPWWAAYWEQYRLESDVKQLHVGDTYNLERGRLPQVGAECFFSADIERNTFGLSRYFLRSAAYFIIYRYPSNDLVSMEQLPCSSLQVYRLPPVPKDYLAHREAHSGSHLVNSRMPLESPQEAYTRDFFFFLRNCKSLADYGIRCELIYSDPPAMPKAK